MRTWSAPQSGSFRTPEIATLQRDVTLAWSADTVGQGWGINTEWGGLSSMTRCAAPDRMSSSTAATPSTPTSTSRAEIKLDDGSVWKNVVTEAKSKVGETLDEFRGNYKYNLLDEHMRRFNAEVPEIVLWDDHEVRDNWYDTAISRRTNATRSSATALLAARARQAFLEFNPVGTSSDDAERIYRVVHYSPLVDVFVMDLRSYRGANSENRQSSLTPDASILGAGQLAALKAQLSASRATWKVIASDMPLGLVVRDGDVVRGGGERRSRGSARARARDCRPPRAIIRAQNIRNVVWITGDVHYCAAHHYDPSRAVFTDFSPFWEFVAGPLNAGTFGPATARQDLRPGSSIRGHSAGHERESSAERRFSVFRHVAHRCAQARVDGAPARSGGKDSIQHRASTSVGSAFINASGAPPPLALTRRSACGRLHSVASLGPQALEIRIAKASP